MEQNTSVQDIEQGGVNDTKRRLYAELETLILTGKVDAKELKTYIKDMEKQHKESESKGRLLTIRLSDKDIETIKSVSKARNTTVSELLRNAISELSINPK